MAVNEDGLSTEVMTINDFLSRTKTDNINLFKIEKYFLKSDIVKKINGFFEKITQLQLNNASSK